MAKIFEITSPDYDANEDLWEAYRLVGEGGEAFLEEYLIQRPKESTTAFTDRKDITYIPSYSKAALQAINNSITQRLVSVRRVGGSETYTASTLGQLRGVDRARSSMSKFLTSEVVPELTMMGGIGILIDAPSEEAITLKDDAFNIPYLYTYPVEDIRAWAKDPNDPAVFSKVLLRDHAQVLDEEYGLATDVEERFRLYELEEGFVSLTIFDAEGEEISSTTLDIPEIPFVLGRLSSSLIADTYRHQISMLNLGSADMVYAWEGNSPFLAEMYDNHDPKSYYSQADGLNEDGSEDSQVPVNPAKRYLGTKQGIRVPKGIEFPKYISPDADPLRVSMEKQEQIKNQISELINQTLRTVTSRSSSAESKKVDERKEEDGLKAIGDELEAIENKIAVIWSYFEGSDTPAEVHYPTSYQFESSSDKRARARDLSDLMRLTPSKTAQKKIAKELVYTLVSQGSTEAEIQTMYAEIDSAEGVIADPESIAKMVEMDVLDTETAAVQIGFSVETARKAHTERIKRAGEIALAQVNSGDTTNNGARGNDALAVNPEQEAKEEKNG